jgi:ubiquinone/menaquinone biosynthesis C-methylase UbiE
LHESVRLDILPGPPKGLPVRLNVTLQYSDNLHNHLITLRREMFRVLKPEGMAIVGTWHSLQTMDIARAIAKYYNKPHNPELDKAFSLADRTLITKVNFNRLICPKTHYSL